MLINWIQSYAVQWFFDNIVHVNYFKIILITYWKMKT